MTKTRATTFKSYFVQSRSQFRPWSAGTVITAGEQLAQFVNEHQIRVIQTVTGVDEITILYEPAPTVREESPYRDDEAARRHDKAANEYIARILTSGLTLDRMGI
jgi:lysophospholipase L1-like esterase